jgi:hypothetical protein
MEGPFHATFDKSGLIFSLHTSGLVFDTHVLQPLWDRFELQALTIYTVSINVNLWHTLFRHQARLCALDICARSSVSMLEALRSDTSFLPALSRLLLRSSDVRIRKGHWMTDRLQNLLLEAFSPERGVRKLDES